ncbi:MAG TPA: hypothetical protein PLM07_11025 [Candidatus Rifleibacterium sp.]|nr:hypothetical protein [Candidatus Rifleibacterium sp.]HPT46425.1 hypothetical protein [Candidatus Rifleibacterium sp.]
MEKKIESGLNWNQAENLRKENRFAEALPIFMAYFAEHRDEPTLWRCVHCARHLKDYNTALELIENNYQDFTGSQMLRVQFAWLKYDALIPTARKRSDWEGILKIADEIFELNPEDGEILFRLTLFAAIDAARNLNDYRKMLELTDLIAPEKLAAEGESFKGRRMISWRERWYFARLHALFEAALYEDCRRLAFRAFSEYPRKIEFARRAALCRDKMAARGDAEEELMAITKVRGCPWYILADLAKIRFELGKYDEALDSAIAAAGMHGDLKTKVNLFSLIGKILLVLGESDAALHHVTLSCSIRNREHWKIPDDLKQLSDRFGLGGNLPAPEIALKNCSGFWRQSGSQPARQPGCRESQTYQKPSVPALAEAPVKTGLKGILGAVPEGRPFSFITSSDYQKPVYVKLTEIPEELRYEGARLSFDLVESFDQKKGEKSVRAANVSVEKTLARAA